MTGRPNIALLLRILVAFAVLYLVLTMFAQKGAEPDLPLDPATGRPTGAAPEIQLAALLQGPADTAAALAGLKTRTVVLDFWASWCPPCRASIPHMNKLAAATADLPVQFLAVTDEPAAKVEPFLEKNPIDAWIGIDRGKATNRAFGVKVIPYTFVIAPDGTILWSGHPMKLNESLLRSLVAGGRTEP